MGGQSSDSNRDQSADFWILPRHSSYILQEAKIVMQRWPDNLHLLGRAKQRWQARNLKSALNWWRSMRSRKDIHTSDQKLQSPQRRVIEPKGGKGGKNTQDGKGKDHQSSPASRQTPLQPKSIRSSCCLQPRLRRPQGRGRAAMAAFPDPSGSTALCKIPGEDRGSFPRKGYLKGGRRVATLGRRDVK